MGEADARLGELPAAWRQFLRPRPRHQRREAPNNDTPSSETSKHLVILLTRPASRRAELTSSSPLFRADAASTQLGTELNLAPAQPGPFLKRPGQPNQAHHLYLFPPLHQHFNLISVILPSTDYTYVCYRIAARAETGRSCSRTRSINVASPRLSGPHEAARESRHRLLLVRAYVLGYLRCRPLRLCCAALAEVPLLRSDPASRQPCHRLRRVSFYSTRSSTRSSTPYRVPLPRPLLPCPPPP